MRGFAMAVQVRGFGKGSGWDVNQFGKNVSRESSKVSRWIHRSDDRAINELLTFDVWVRFC
jgi:hypothetical protein